MTVVLEKLTDVQDGVVDALGKVKEPVARSVSVVIDFVLDNAPQIPSFGFGKEIPTPTELINNQYKFAKAIIDANKDIALAAAKAAAPVTDRLLDRKAAQSAAKPSAAKAPARKTTATRAG